MENPYQSSEPQWAGYEPAGGEPVSDEVVEALSQTRPWTMVCAVLGFLGGGMMLLLGVGVTLLGVISPEILEEATQDNNGFNGVPPLWIGLIYVFISFLYFVPSGLLYRYSKRIRRLALETTQDNLLGALQSQKSFWKVVGVGMIVMLGLSMILFIGGMIVGMIAAMR